MSQLVVAPHHPPGAALDVSRAIARRRALGWPRFSDRAIARLVMALALFNFVDATLTIALVRAGLASEANPLMAASLSAGPGWFMLHKFVLVGGGLTILWFTRRRGLAQAGLVLSVVVYSVLMLVHTWSCKLLLAHYLGA